MNSSWCPVHLDTENCLEWRLGTLKVAIACAVLRNKPPGQSTRQFLNNLRDFHENKEERWKGEYQRLKQEVLQLRQQISLLTSQQATRDTQPLLVSQAGGESQTSDYFSQELDVLTPPDSQLVETQLERPLTCLTLSSRSERESNHSEFLRAFFYLEHRLRAGRQSISSVNDNREMLENEVVSRSVFTVLRHVKQGMDFNGPTFKTCRDSLHVCLQFLDHQSTLTPAIRDELADVSCHWLDYLHDNGHMTKVFSLLITLAESQSMALALADFLANRTIESQKVLSTWKWDGQNLIPQNVLQQFCSVSCYLVLLEKTIPRLTPSAKSRLIDTLSHIEPQVHTHFPLFSFSMLRIVNLLSSST